MKEYSRLLSLIALFLIIWAFGAVGNARQQNYEKQLKAASETAAIQATVKPSVAVAVAKTIEPAPNPPTQASIKSGSCAQAEAKLGPIYDSDLASVSSIWSDSNNPGNTSARNNYNYNQSAQQEYSLYVQYMKVYGCDPVQPSPTLKLPATAPSSASVTTTPAPTCNTALEAQYESEYSSAYAGAQQWEQAQIQSVNAQIGNMGGGTSSAIQQADIIIGSQFSSKVSALKATLNSELVSIDCPTS